MRWLIIIIVCRCDLERYDESEEIKNQRDIFLE